MFANYLYVEDDPLSREVMQTLLIDVIGVKSLVIFENSQDFLPRLKALQPQPDCIFLDINIEPYNGHELIAMIRSDLEVRAIPVIAVTASILSKLIGQLQQEGFSGAINKPLDMLTFPAIMEKIGIGQPIWFIE